MLADVWDTVYFERISRCGYEFEQYLAFFPGLPLILSWFSHDVTTAVITGLLVTTLSFCFSAVMMYRCVQGQSRAHPKQSLQVPALHYLCTCRIGRHVLKDDAKAATAVLLMCLSPASVFLSMAYTEAIFQALTFLGVWLLINCDAPLLSAIPFSASCAIRSNGMAVIKISAKTRHWHRARLLCHRTAALSHSCSMQGWSMLDSFCIIVLSPLATPLLAGLLGRMHLQYAFVPQSDC